MNKQDEILFSEAIENICGEANEAAKLSLRLFEGPELELIRRELARLMEIVEGRILPIYRKKFKEDKME